MYKAQCSKCFKSFTRFEQQKGLLASLCPSCQAENEYLKREKYLEQLASLPVGERLRRLEETLYDQEHRCSKRHDKF